MTPEQITVLVGMFLPILVGALVKANASSKVKGTVALVLTVTIGTLIAVLSGDVALATLNFSDVGQTLQFVGIVLVASQSAYNMFIKPSGLAQYVQESIPGIFGSNEETSTEEVG